MWDCRSTNHKGKTLENIINNDNLCLFNKKSPTHLDPSSATYSAIDLTLCDTSLFLDFTWRVYDDTCGSNHFPIVLESLHPQDDDLRRWRLNKANWEEFCSQCQKHLIVNNTETILEFSKKLINIAKTCIPHNPTTHKRDRPWFSKECKQAIHLRWAALWKFNIESTTSNLISFKFHRANAHEIIKEAKKKSWQNYVSKLNASFNIKTVLLMIWKIAGKKQSTLSKHLPIIEHQWIALTFKPIVTWLAPWKASQLKLTSFIKECMSSMRTACGLAHFTRMDLSNSFAWVVSIHLFYPQQNYWGGSLFLDIRLS